MKRVLRITIFGPIYLTAGLAILAVYPVMALIAWCFYDDYSVNEFYADLFHDAVSELWVGQPR